MISRYSAHGLTWIDLESPTTEETAHIVEEFSLPHLVGQEMLDNTIRSKVDLYPEFLYLILHFPIINHAAAEGTEQEIDFIIGKKFLITVRYELVDPVIDFAKLFESNSRLEHINMAEHGGMIFTQMIKAFYKKSLHQLEDMTQVLKEIERRIFSSQEASIVRDISRASRKLLDFKQSIRFHGEVLKSYESASKRLFGEQYSYYAEVVTSEYNKVNSILESHRDVLAELQRTNDSLLSSKSNEILKIFTIMTFVMLPLTLITGVFGMNTASNLVFIKSMSDFYFVIGAMVITGLIMFLFSDCVIGCNMETLKLYNTKSRSIETFIPLNAATVTMYACGPTVYDYTHIGHMRKYIGDDILRRTLLLLGYSVTHVMNITDVGHLTNDSDEGDDKFEKKAVTEGKSVWDIAKFYTKYFHKTMQAVNVLPPTHETKATDHIPAMIALIETLIAKGFAYETDQAVYFDVSKDPHYGELSRQKLSDKEIAVRDDVVIDLDKKTPADFSLWFKRVGKFADHAMYWQSPKGIQGDGFPGWHIECSAMAMQYLGETIDIHTGGVDHIPVHHENEIAQSECATGRQFVRFWVHYEFLNVDGVKMSKSLQNFYTVEDIVARNINPLAVRLMVLQTSYRKPLNFTWQSLQVAHDMLKKLQKFAALQEAVGESIGAYCDKFRGALCDDLNTAAALAIVWELFGDMQVRNADKWATLLYFDQVLGLDLATVAKFVITDEAKALVIARDTARANKDFSSSDTLRIDLEALGYVVLDTTNGTILQ